MTEGPTFLSLCAGVGGLDLGLERAGWQPAGQVEVHPQRRAVLATHWPDVPRHDDIRTAHNFIKEVCETRTPNLIAAGFPCQDLSTSGLRAGLAGPKSSLYWNVLDVVATIRPRLVLFENVVGLLSSNRGRDFAVVLSSLAESGYPYAEWRVLDSQNHGVPQRRRRVFISASAAPPSTGAVLLEPARSSASPPVLSGTRTSPDPVPRRRACRAGLRCPTTWHHTVMSTLLASDYGGLSAEGALGGRLIRHTHQGRRCVRRLTPAEYERLQGFPEGWTAELADTQRYAALGDAVTVPVAAHVGHRLLRSWERKVSHI